MDRADELAAEVVRVKDGDRSPRLMIGNFPNYDYSSMENAEHDAAAIRRIIATAIRHAVAEALSSGLPGMPLEADAIAAMHWRSDGCKPVESSHLAGHHHNLVGLALRTNIAEADRRELLAHVAYLDGLLRDLSQDNAGEIYRRGVEDGRRIEREEGGKQIYEDIDFSPFP